jgi:hypothetical protein
VVILLIIRHFFEYDLSEFEIEYHYDNSYKYIILIFGEVLEPVEKEVLFKSKFKLNKNQNKIDGLIEKLEIESNANKYNL